MLNLDKILQGVTFKLDDSQKWGFKSIGATEEQTAYIATYKISVLTHLQELPPETHALQCPYCQATPHWNGASRYQGKMTLVCPKCADQSTLSEAALNTFYRWPGKDGAYYRPTVDDYNTRIQANG